MSTERFLTLLMMCSAITTLAVEASKKMLGGRKVSYNILAAIEAVITAGVVSAAYIILTETPLDAKVGVHVFALVVFSWMCSMLGFDKIKQTLLQIKTTEYQQ